VGETLLLGYGEAKISAEPAGIFCPSGAEFGDQSPLSPERDPDAAGKFDCPLALPD